MRKSSLESRQSQGFKLAVWTKSSATKFSHLKCRADSLCCSLSPAFWKPTLPGLFCEAQTKGAQGVPRKGNTHSSNTEQSRSCQSHCPQPAAGLNKGILPGWPYQEPTVTLPCPAHWFGAFYVVLLCKLFACWGILQDLGPGHNNSHRPREKGHGVKSAMNGSH